MMQGQEKPFQAMGVTILGNQKHSWKACGYYSMLKLCRCNSPSKYMNESVLECWCLTKRKKDEVRIEIMFVVIHEFKLRKRMIRVALFEKLCKFVQGKFHSYSRAALAITSHCQPCKNTSHSDFTSQQRPDNLRLFQYCRYIGKDKSKPFKLLIKWLWVSWLK